MRVETSKSILSVFGIVAIVYGVFELLFGFLITAGGRMLASGRISAEGGITSRTVLMAGSVFLLLGVFAIVEGVLSRRAVKDMSGVQAVYVMAIISLGLAVSSLVSVIACSGSPASSLVSVVINVLLVLAADNLRKDLVTA